MPSKPKTDNTAMRELKQALRSGAPGRLYLFYGEEAYLREYYLGELKKTLLPEGLEDFNLHTAEGKACSVAWIEQAVNCFPMMSERTLVLVTDFDLFGLNESDRDTLISLLADLSKVKDRSRATSPTGSAAASRPPGIPSTRRTPVTSFSCAAI